MSRYRYIIHWLNEMQEAGDVHHWYTCNNMPGRKWIIAMAGFSERSMTTNEVEWYILGWRVAKVR